MLRASSLLGSIAYRLVIEAFVELIFDVLSASSSHHHVCVNAGRSSRSSLTRRLLTGYPIAQNDASHDTDSRRLFGTQCLALNAAFAPAELNTAHVIRTSVILQAFPVTYVVIALTASPSHPLNISVALILLTSSSCTYTHMNQYICQPLSCEQNLPTTSHPQHQSSPSSGPPSSLP